MDWLDANFASPGLAHADGFHWDTGPLSPHVVSLPWLPWNDSLRILSQDGRGRSFSSFEAQALNYIASFLPHSADQSKSARAAEIQGSGEMMNGKVTLQKLMLKICDHYPMCHTN